MKKLLPFTSLLPAFLFLFLLAGCDKDKQATMTYTIKTPIWGDKATILEGISSGPARPLERPGKLFIKGKYIFINEIDKGIHIIDNSDPSNPVPVAFVDIPGNIDVAANANYLYADLYTDMLTIDISDPTHVKLVDTAANVFPERLYGNGWYPNNEGQVIIGWNEKDTTVTYIPSRPRIWESSCAGCFAIPAAAGGDMTKANSVPGIAGSMSRLVLVNNYLYTVNSSSLLVFDVTDPSLPIKKAENSFAWQIETIYPFRNNLFIGMSNGMVIFDISNPLEPQQVGSFGHVSACDPVVSDGKYAYVTLRSGTECQGFTNQLDVLDISNLTKPDLVKTYSMSNPFGLAKDGNLLFVCDGKAGIKVYDATDAQNLRMVSKIWNVEAYDAIPWSKRLIVSTAEGLKQYDYSDLDNIHLLSSINVVPRR